jgi:hypothetical protein
VQILTITAEDIEHEFKKIGQEFSAYPTPFEFLMANCYNNKEFMQLTKKAFSFFCHTTITFLFEDKKIIIDNVKNLAEES